MLRCIALASVCLASGASAQTTLYAEAIGATGLYAIGVEQGILSSADGSRHLALRAAGSYWTELPLNAEVATTLHTVAVPVGAVASFSLGRPNGVPLAMEVGGGAVLIRRTGGFTDHNGNTLSFPLYGDVALRATFGRVAARGGLLAGGDNQHDLADFGDVRPVLSLGISL